MEGLAADLPAKPPEKHLLRKQVLRKQTRRGWVGKVNDYSVVRKGGEGDEEEESIPHSRPAYLSFS